MRLQHAFVSVIAALTIIGVASGGAPPPAMVNVPADFSSIQDAIDHVADGGHVIVAPGTYYELVNFNGRAVTLRSSGGAEATTIDAGGGNGPVISVVGGEGSHAVIDGFTLTGASGNTRGGGIRCNSSSPTVRNCIFTGNDVIKGGGIHCEGEATPVVFNCIFENNHASSHGGGFSSTSSASPVIIACTFRDNTANEGGAVSALGATPLLVNCIFLRNEAETEGGGVLVDDGGVATIINSTFYENVSGDLGGAVKVRDSGATIRNTISWSNSPDEIRQKGESWLDVQYSNVRGGIDGAGNIDLDPNFVDPGSDDLRLGDDSPCIDTGDSDAVPDDTFDIDRDGDKQEPLPVDRLGNPRFVDDPDSADGGAGNGPIVDMGANEYLGPVLAPPQEFAAAGEAVDEVEGDLDGDGDTDVVIVIPDLNPLLPGQIQVFLNNGVDAETGDWNGFTALAPVAVGRDPSSATVGFFDLDGTLDVAVANAGDNDVSILLGNGDGTFSSGGQLPVGTEPRSIASGDFTLDGFEDLVVANSADNNVQVYANLIVPAVGQSASFGLTESIDAGNDPGAIDPTDLDNDKDLDMAFINKGDDNVQTVMFAQGMSEESATQDVGDDPSDLSTGDVNGDDRPDVVTSNRGDGTVSVLLNAGMDTPAGVPTGGPLAPAVSIPVGANPKSITLGDLDNDGDRDIAVVADDVEVGAVVQVLENEVTDQELIFVGPFSYPVEDDPAGDADPNAVVAADLDGDGTTDLVTVNGTDGDAGEEGEGSVTALISEPECFGDLDGDGGTGFTDLTQLLRVWGPCDPEPQPCPEDFDNDGLVTMMDLMNVLRNWGNVCP